MGEFFDRIGDFITAVFVLRHMPFFVISITLGLLGIFFSRRVWTKERAEAAGKWRRFWQVGRDTQPVHPIAGGALWMLIWGDPMGYGYNARDSLGYGALAGAIGLFLWVAGKIYAKRKYGLDDIPLPGDSIPVPGPGPSSDEDTSDADER